MHFAGYLPSQQGWLIIRNCHIGLALVASRPSLREAFPTKLFEYMAMALPVITSDFPLYRSVVDRHACGLCVDPDSAHAIADAIEQLVSDPKRAEEMGTRGREAVLSAYCWANEFAKLESFYEQLR